MPEDACFYGVIVKIISIIHTRCTGGVQGYAAKTLTGLITTSTSFPASKKSFYKYLKKMFLVIADIKSKRDTGSVKILQIDEEQIGVGIDAFRQIPFGTGVNAYDQTALGVGVNGAYGIIQKGIAVGQCGAKYGITVADRPDEVFGISIKGQTPIGGIAVKNIKISLVGIGVASRITKTDGIAVASESAKFLSGISINSHIALQAKGIAIGAGMPHPELNGIGISNWAARAVDAIGIGIKGGEEKLNSLQGIAVESLAKLIGIHGGISLEAGHRIHVGVNIAFFSGLRVLQRFKPKGGGDGEEGGEGSADSLGGGVVDGAAMYSWDMFYESKGGAVAEGHAVIDVVQFKVYLGTGGAVAGGAARIIVLKNVLFTGSGGAVAGGQAITDAVQFKVHLGRGGAVASGAGVFSPTRVALSIVWGHFGTYTYPYSTSSALNPSRANIDGKFTWPTLTPDAGTTMVPVTFTPTDRVNYAPMTHDVPIVVNKAASVISWTQPTAITYGTALSATQLNATANVPGTFLYNRAAGTVLNAGNHALQVTFTPTDATNYGNDTDGVWLDVYKKAVSITWATPAAITYGAALSATQLNATANVAGSFTYTPTAGTILDAGVHAIICIFTPDDTENYANGVSSVSFTVNKANQAAVYCTVSNLSFVVGSITTATGSGGSGTGEWVFQSSNANVVTVSSSGAVTAVGVGTASISAQKSGDANYTDSVWANWSTAITVRAAIAAYVGGSYKEVLFLTGGSGVYGWSMTGGLTNITLRSVIAGSGSKYIAINNVYILPHCYAPNGYFRIWDANDISNVLIFYYSSFFPLTTASLNGYTPIPACASDPLVPSTITVNAVPATPPHVYAWYVVYYSECSLAAVFESQLPDHLSYSLYTLIGFTGYSWVSMYPMRTSGTITKNTPTGIRYFNVLSLYITDTSIVDDIYQSPHPISAMNSALGLSYGSEISLSDVGWWNTPYGLENRVHIIHVIEYK